MSKILITGANGYIGYHLVKQLCDEGDTVLAVDIKNDRIDERAEFINCNLFSGDCDLVEHLAKDNKMPDIYVNLACKDVAVHNSLWHINSIPLVLDLFKSFIDNGTKRVITVGSMHDVGYFEGMVTEDVIPNPTTFYGISKDTIRRLVASYAVIKGVSHAHLRFFYTYGDDLQSSGSIFSKILQMEQEGKTMFPFTDGLNQFDYTEIHELARYISNAAKSNYTGIINCCSGKPITIKDMVNKFLADNNLKIRPEYGAFPSRPYDSPCIYGDAALINKIMKDK